MSYDKVKQAKEIIVGTKQTLKALEGGEVQEMIVASDADERIVSKVKIVAQQLDIPITTVDSMKKLGIACGIEVGAATVAIKK